VRRAAAPRARPAAARAPRTSARARGRGARALTSRAPSHLLWCLPAGEVAARTGGSALVDGFCGGLVCCCLTPPLCLYAVPWAMTRARLRAQLGHPPDALSDALVACCLPPCYLAQALNELDLAGAAGAPALSAPAAPAPARAAPAAHGWGPGVRLGDAAVTGAARA